MKTDHCSYPNLYCVLAIPTAKKKYDPNFESKSLSSASADSSSSSASESGDGGVERIRRRIPKICLFVQQIQEQVQSLFGISSVLRRLETTGIHIRPSALKEQTSTPEIAETVPLNVAFGIFDERHIVEKILQWRGMTKSGKNITFEEEEGATESPPESMLESVKDISWLCQRLAQANTRRREQLRYWRDHPYASWKDITAISECVRRSRQTTVRQGDQDSNSGTTHGLPTVAVSDVHDIDASWRTQTVNAPTAIGQDQSNSDPKTPEIEEEMFMLPCPYCGMVLDYEEVQNNQCWK